MSARIFLHAVQRCIPSAVICNKVCTLALVLIHALHGFIHGAVICSRVYIAALVVRYTCCTGVYTPSGDM